MFNPYSVIVRRAVEYGGGPPQLVRWVRAEVHRLTARTGNPLPNDRLVELLADQLVRRLVPRGSADTVLKEPAQTVRLEVEWV